MVTYAWSSVSKFIPGQVVVPGAEAELRQDLGALVLRGGTVESHRTPEEHEMLLRSEQVEQRRILRAVPHPSAPLHGARVRGQQPGADAQQRRLAGAVLAHDRNDLAGAQDKLGAVEHESLAEALHDS